MITMEIKSLRDTQTYHSRKSWLSQIRMCISQNNCQAPFKTFARFHSDASILLLKALWTLWRPLDPIFIMSGNSCLEQSSPISPRTLDFTLGQSIGICNSCFSDNFSEDADKAVWRFVAFRRFKNCDLKYLVRVYLSLSSR